ncbi:MAG: hypothetical protein IJX70_04580 [Clostridia bacterium]|nr:hypothetical protein [Clostridia bacterium]
MSYANFIPAVWEAGINRDLERKCVFVEDCYRKYEGAVKRMGESVTITGIGRPTIHTLHKDMRNGEIENAETVETTAVLMPINQIAYYNYEIGDIDKAQALDGVVEALQEETTEGLANQVDQYIAGLAISPEATVLGSAYAVVGEAGENEKNVLDILDELQEALLENDVADSAEIVVTVDPKFFTRFRKEYRNADTDNSQILKKGRVYYYNGMKIKVSNNVARHEVSLGGATVMASTVMARTKRAIAFVKPLTHTEAYRPEKKFVDAVKGFVLYDAKIVRPKELFVYNVAY